MSFLLLAMLLVGVDAKPVAVSPRPSPAEFGHGLTEQDARAGWISLFDGKTTFGWQGATVKDGLLSGGENDHFVVWRFDFRDEVKQVGKFHVGDYVVDFGRGSGKGSFSLGTPSRRIVLGEGLQFEKLAIRRLI